MSIFEEENFITISLMICFNLDLDQNIGLNFFYLPDDLHVSKMNQAWEPKASLFFQFKCLSLH
jgi:hypothetical protein